MNRRLRTLLCTRVALRAVLPLAALAGAPAWGALPVYDHVVVVIEENHSFEDIVGSPEAPYINGVLIDEGMLMTDFYALTRPSQPNYLHLFSGDSQGVTHNGRPAGAPFTTPNLGAALRSAGRSFIGYAEDLPEVGFDGEEAAGILYARKHNPWVNWQWSAPGAPANALPPEVNRPFSDFPRDPGDFARLPTVSFVVPNQVNDMHEEAIPPGDDWLAANLHNYYQWARENNSLLIVTFDEDSFSSGNRIPTIFAGAHIASGRNDRLFTLHDLLRTIEDMYQLPHAGRSARARAMEGVFAGEQPRGEVVELSQGRDGYSLTQDTELRAASPDLDRGAASAIEAALGDAAQQQGLLRFDGLIGPGNGQVPPGAVVLSARLRITTTYFTSTSPVEVRRALVSWDESSTWQSLAGGLATDGVELASLAEDAIVPDGYNSAVVFDVTDSVQRWARGEANYGWALLATGSRVWQWNSSEGASPSLRPTLEVVYLVPEPAGAALSLAGLAGAAALVVRRRRRDVEARRSEL